MSKPKRCPACGETDLAQFRPQGRGLQTYCKDCSRVKLQEWRGRNMIPQTAGSDKVRKAKPIGNPDHVPGPVYFKQMQTRWA